MIQDQPYDVINHVPFSKWGGLEGSNLYLVHTQQEWDAFFEVLMSKKSVACDTETSGFRYYDKDHIVGMSFGWGKEHFYVPVRHEDSCIGGKQLPQLNMDVLRPNLQQFFAQKDVFVVGHGFKFDMHFYKADDIDILNPLHDTMLFWHLYNENAPKALKVIFSGWVDELGIKHKGLIGPEASAKEKELSEWRAAEAEARRKRFSGVVMARADALKSDISHQGKNRNVLKKWIIENELLDHPDYNVKKDDIHYGFVPIELMTEYAAIDTFLTGSLFDYLTENMILTQDLVKIYKNEIKLCRKLFEIEEGGTKIDSSYLFDFEKELTTECEVNKKQIYTQLGNINLDSGDQLASALQDIGVVLAKKTPSGRFCMDAGVLEGLSKEYPIVKDILHLRGTEKLLSTYVLGIQDKVIDGSLHANFNQNVSTGRMSCRDPNLTNIPRGDTRIRKAFICPEDCYFVFADYSQVEVRLTAHYSKDPLLLDALNKKQDIHARTMSEMFDIKYNEVIEVLKNDQHDLYKEYNELRNVSKTLNFAIIYGVGAPGLSTQIPRSDKYKDSSDKEWVAACQDFIEQYFRKYRGIKRFISRCKREVRENSQIVNSFGRIRHLPAAKATNILGDKAHWMEAKAERQAANFVIQATAADVFKTAIVRVDEEVLKNTKSRIVNLIHDEIQFFIAKDELHLLNPIRDIMEDFDFLVPLTVDFAYSTTSWADKKELT